MSVRLALAARSNCRRQGQNALLESPTGSTNMWLYGPPVLWTLNAHLPRWENPVFIVCFAGVEVQVGQRVIIHTDALSNVCVSLPSNWKPPGSTAPDRPAAGPPLIIFASRTHSQIQQAVKQLKMTNYRSSGSMEIRCYSLPLRLRLVLGLLSSLHAIRFVFILYRRKVLA